MKNRILITGASGLIGVGFIDSLSSKNDVEIWAWVKNDIPEYLKDTFKKCHHVIQKDITEKNSFDDLPEFDIIIHSSGYAQPEKFLSDKIRTIEINTMSTIWLIEKLKKYTGKFLFISSSEVYNGIDKYMIKETDIGNSNTDHPRSCYINSKKCGESICYSYIENGYDIKIARLGLTYGPYVKKGDKRVMNTLIEEAMFEDAIYLLDGGDAVRTFCFVTDAIEMMWNILLNGREIVYNVGGVERTSILELAKKIGKYFDKEIIIPLDDNSLAGSPKIVNIDISKYVGEFGPKNFISLDNGLNKTIDWLKYIQSF